MAQEKSLYIGRHAKSSWDFPGREDIDRPLAERGLQNAYEMVQRMKKRGEGPEFIISSPANRALHTAVIFARELKLPMSRLSVNEGLYMTGEDTIMEIVAGINDSINAVMIVGHNPDFTHFANYFLKDQIYNIPTCGLVKLVFDVSRWEDIHRGRLIGHLIDFPKKKPPTPGTR